MRIGNSRQTYLALLAVLFFTEIAIPCIGWAQGSPTAQYHLVKKIVLGPAPVPSQRPEVGRRAASAGCPS